MNREIGNIADDNAYICPFSSNPDISAVIAPEPNIKTGNINGNKTNAVKPPFPIAQDKAAGVAPIKVREGVPIKRVKANIHQYSKSKPIIIDNIGESNTIGSPLVTQWAKHLDKTISSIDIPDKTNCSKEPSSKIDLNNLSRDNNEENIAAIHIAPAAIEVRRLVSVPDDKGNIIIASR